MRMNFFWQRVSNDSAASAKIGNDTKPEKQFMSNEKLASTTKLTYD